MAAIHIMISEPAPRMHIDWCVCMGRGVAPGPLLTAHLTTFTHLPSFETHFWPFGQATLAGVVIIFSGEGNLRTGLAAGLGLIGLIGLMVVIVPKPGLLEPWDFNPGVPIGGRTGPL